MKWRILIVDDEPDVRMIIKATLEPKYEVIEASDGLDALERIERSEPDYVIMDIMMPLMNGHEACTAIRNNPKFRELPVMFLSALGSRDDIKKGYSHGANMYLTKPFEPSRLLKNVDVFFESTPPDRTNKRYTIEELRNAESTGKTPVSPGSAEWETPSFKENIPISKETASVNAGDSVPMGTPRVMAVDDDQEIIELIRISLDGFAEVVWANDGLQAIERLVKYQPDILLIDIMLPKMNGFQLCQSLRANRAFARLPIMMCSAKGQDRDKVFAKRLGANDYLVKPFSPSALITKVKELQHLPGFRVRPKTLKIEQIHDIDIPKDQEDVFTAGEDSRPVDQGSKGTQGAIGKFLQKESNKEGLEHEESQAPTADKKKRRFFGFGG